MDFASLDIGSNSFRLLVVRASGRSLIQLASERLTLGLGRHVKATGRIPSGVFDQALEAVVALVDKAREFRGIQLSAVGTSALRDAVNGVEFARAVQLRTRVTIEIVSGETEARLVYDGARSALPTLPARVVVVDLGGGSVEIAAGEEGWCMPIASLPLGFLRLGRAPGVGGSMDLSAAREAVQGLARDAVERARAFHPQAWVFSGGTARSLCAVSQRLFGGDSQPIPAGRVQKTAELLASAEPSRLQEQGVEPGRIDTLGAGAALLAALVEAFGAEGIYVSSAGLCEGVVLREFKAWTLAEGARISENGRERPSAAKSSRPSASGQV